MDWDFKANKKLCVFVTHSHLCFTLCLSFFVHLLFTPIISWEFAEYTRYLKLCKTQSFSWCFKSFLHMAVTVLVANSFFYLPWQPKHIINSRIFNFMYSVYNLHFLICINICISPFFFICFSGFFVSLLNYRIDNIIIFFSKTLFMCIHCYLFVYQPN